MITAHAISEVCSLPRWPEQLADLTREAWTGHDGKCYFPYRPLTEPMYWATEVLDQWARKTMKSWILVDEGSIIAHVAMVLKEGYWELGRWVALKDAPRGAVHGLCEKAMEWTRHHNLAIQVECTQAHSSSQYICERLGLRFAGLGILAAIEGVAWDIIYYDNLETLDFIPKPGIIGEPLRRPVKMKEEFRSRLIAVSEIITTTRGGDLPPQHFHILPHREETVRQIIRMQI